MPGMLMTAGCGRHKQKPNPRYHVTSRGEREGVSCVRREGEGKIRSSSRDLNVNRWKLFRYLENNKVNELKVWRTIHNIVTLLIVVPVFPFFCTWQMLMLVRFVWCEVVIRYLYTDL